MKVLIIPVFFIAAVGSFFDPQTTIAGVVLVVVLGVLYHLYNERAKEVEKLRLLSRRLKNIYVKSDHPNDTTVVKRCREYMDLLIKSGNKFRGPVKAVKVYGIIFQDLDVVQFYLEESPNDGKVRIAKKRINVDKDGLNAIETFEASENPEDNTYPKRCAEFIAKNTMERAKEVRFNITDKDIEKSDEKNESFWETQWLQQEQDIEI